MGRKWERKNFKDPDHFYELFLEYVQYNETDTLTKRDVVRSGDRAGQLLSIQINQPLTWAGFETYLQLKGVLMFTKDYRANKNNKYDEYADIISACEAQMYHSKYGGAATNLLNANIISRDLGLIDKVEQSITVEQPLFDLG